MLNLLRSKSTTINVRAYFQSLESPRFKVDLLYYLVSLLLYYTMKRFMSLTVVLAFTLFLAGCGATTESTTSSPAIAELASCLTTNGATFYGTEWCPHCKDQKKLFGEALAKVNYVDCDANKMACTNAGVK
jgi:thiol-disulfide isomerase/thioredoxin